MSVSTETLARWHDLAQRWLQSTAKAGYAWQGKAPLATLQDAWADGLEEGATLWPDSDAPRWALGRWEDLGVALSCDERLAPLALALVQQGVEWARATRLSSQLTNELIAAWDWLNFLFKLTEVAGRHLELKPVLQKVLQLVPQVSLAREAFLALKGPEGHQIFSTAAPGHKLAERLLKQALPKDQVLIWDRTHTRPALLHDLGTDWDSLAVVVLPLEPPYHGVLGLRDLNRPLLAAQQSLLLSVARQIAALIRAVLARETQMHVQRLEQELLLSRQIQESLLPRHLPEVPNAELAVVLEPASRVGGDFYDVQAIGPHLFVMLGDVAGKGIPAAMMTTLLHAAFHSEIPVKTTALEVLNGIHAQTSPELDQAETFVTLGLLVLDWKTRQFTYASAGHTDALLIRAKNRAVESLKATGLPLGVQEQARYSQITGRLEEGDVFWLYSDGVTEVQNRKGRVLGYNGLVDVALAVHPGPASQQVEAVRQAVTLHRAGESIGDDMALFALRIRAPDEPLAISSFVRMATQPEVGALVHQLTAQAAQWAAQHRASEEGSFLAAWELGVTELLTNIVQHAYRRFQGRVQGCLMAYPDRLVLDVWDSGDAFSTGPLPAFRDLDPQNPREHGYGLRLVHRTMDCVRYQRLHQRNWWRLEKSWSTVEESPCKSL